LNYPEQDFAKRDGYSQIKKELYHDFFVSYVTAKAICWGFLAKLPSRRLWAFWVPSEWVAD